MKPNMSAVVLSVIAGLLAASAATAQEKVPGEKWRMKMSMQTEGFSMPARTTEMCLPIAKPEEAMMRPQSADNSNCTMSNLRQSGNKTSADIKCTGKEAMDGHMEVEKLSENSVRGAMTGNTSGMSMKMEYEYTKLGQACEAIDYSNYKPPVVNLTPIDFCAQAAEKFDPRNLTASGIALLQKYPTADGKGMADCSKHAGFKQFCSAAQTPSGFAQLDSAQWRQRDVPVYGDESNDASLRMNRTPLTETMRACGLGAGEAGIASLQKRMMGVAEKERLWGFQLYYGVDAHYADIRAIAQRECSGRSFTNAANQDYLGLCRRYGAVLARDDRPGVLAAAGCTEEREDRVRDICIGARGEGSGVVTDAGDADAVTGSSSVAGSAQPGAGAAQTGSEAADDADKDGAKNKAKDALDKGKRALRGLFGGG